jgi:hypothetical protein
MIKKIVFLVVLAGCFSAVALSQRFIHSMGTTVPVIYGNAVTASSSAKLVSIQVNWCYFPRYNFIESKNSSVSIGFPVSAGIGTMFATAAPFLSITYGYDLPAVIDYNIGYGCTKENKKNLGGYVGGGFSYTNVIIPGSKGLDFKGVATYGVLVRAGFRMEQRSWHKTTSIGLFYKRGIGAGNLNTSGMNVLYDL